MKKQESKMGLLLATVFILFSSCDKDKKTDPSEIFILYTWTYFEETDKTTITAEFHEDYHYGPGVAAPRPFTITFNGDTLWYGYSIIVPGLADSGTLVYTDVTGASYSVEVKPKQVPQIPDTFTSVDRFGSFIFYWEGDSTGDGEVLEVTFCSLDTLSCRRFSAGPFSYGIHLQPMDGYLTPGTNNTNVSLMLTYSYDLATAAPKGCFMEQMVIGKEKIISVY